MSQREGLRRPHTPNPLPKREALPDLQVESEIQRLNIQHAYVFERIIERDYRNRVDYCYQWARTVGVRVIDEYLALGDEALRDRPIPLVQAMDDCRLDGAALIVYDYNALTIDPGQLFPLMLELREPATDLPHGVPLLIAGTGVVELPTIKD
jgi:hypothetical protein